MRRQLSDLRTEGAFFWSAVLICALLFGIYPWSAVLVVRYGALTKDLGWTAVQQDGHWTVRQVEAEGPAAGGLHAGDRIMALNGERRAVLVDPELALEPIRAGQPYSISVQDGETLRNLSLACGVRKDGRNLFWMASLLLVSLAFYVVGATIGVLKPLDRVARLGFGFCICCALHMIGIALRPLRGVLPPPGLWLYAVTYSVTFIPDALGYHFASRFPAFIPESKGWVWLRRFIYLACVFLFVPVTFFNFALLPGRSTAWPFLISHVQWVNVYSKYDYPLESVYALLVVVAVVAVLARNYSRISQPDDLRRLKWIAYGAAAGTLPLMVHAVALFLITATGNSWFTNSSLWFNFTRFTNIAIVVIPITFGYSVVKYRVLGIDVALRRGLQYLLAKNSLRLILLLPWASIASNMLLHPELPIRDVLSGKSPPFYLAASVAAGLSLKFRKQLMLTIDRKFFRESYNQEQILLDLIEEMNTVDSLEEMSQLVSSKLQGALHLESLRVVFREPSAGDISYRYVEATGTGSFASEPDSRIVRALEEGRKAFQPDERSLESWPIEKVWFGDVDVQLLVPILGADQRALGALCLGPKKSEEPFTKRDRSLLQTIAAQFGVVAENVSLRRRVSDEAQIRQDVLSRLGPGLSLVKECKLCGTCFDSGETVCSRDQSELSLSLPIERVLDGKYRLDRRLGTGSMGAVYKAWDLRLSRPVAIKIMMGRLFGDRVALRRFEREAHASAKLRHPNIITVYDYGVIEGGGAYLVMEFLPGGNLRLELTRARATATPVAARWIDELLAGVKAAHDAGIIHRDLKPENILVARPENAPETIKVLDFGLAKLWDPASTATITIAGHVVGTLGYMSPEQLLGQDVDERTDIFSLGVIMFEALSGRRPFTGSNPRELLAAMDRWDAHLDEPRAGLDDMLRKCLAPNRMDRYSGVGSLREELLPALWAYGPLVRSQFSDSALASTVDYRGV